MYQVRRVHIGKTAQPDALAHACGEVYTQTLVFFWRTVRHKRIWLKPRHLMRLFTSEQLHAHTSDACVQAFFASLTSWRQRKKQGDADAHPPRKRKWYFRIEYKRSAMRLKDGKLHLSNGHGVGAINIRYKYREEFGIPHVVAEMAPATGIRYLPHARVARWENISQRENVCSDNGTEAPRL